MLNKRLSFSVLITALLSLLLLSTPRPTYAATFTVTNTDDSGAGSLRQAILSANSTPGADLIDFNIPSTPGVVNVILVLSSSFNAIIEQVTIDGTTQPGYDGSPLIEIRASTAGLPYGIYVETGNNVTIRGLAITNFTSGSAINLKSGTSGHVIEDSYFGLRADNSDSLPNSTGIFVASNSSIISFNDIEENLSTGIDISGSNNTINGNYIASNNRGIQLNPGAQNNTIGGTAGSSRNIISGNINEGILIQGSAVNSNGSNTIIGNYIGLRSNGTVVDGNGTAGIRIFRSRNNVIGGTAAGSRNLISGNVTGIDIAVDATTPSSNTRIEGNYIGTDVTGTVDLGNIGDGISIASDSTTIGGTAAGARNIISGNNGNGVLISGATALGNSVVNNYIGTDVTGVLNLGNGQHGISIVNGAFNNFVGFTVNAASGNIIAFNGARGVLVNGAANNTINSNRIFSNGGLGIDLADNVDSGLPNPNDLGDADTGANDRQNYPVLTLTSDTTSTISGTLNSTPNTNFVIDLFRTTCDASGYGEGQIYLGSVPAPTDADGNVTFNYALGFLLPGSEGVTATATSPNASNNGNTSEFSACVRPIVDLSLTHTDSPDPILSGQPLSYTINITNTAPVNYAQNVVITETLSTGVTFTQAVPSQGTCNHVSGVVTCNIGTLNNGASANILIDVEVKPTTTGTFTSTASVTAGIADPNTANNIVTQTTTSRQFLPTGVVTTVPYGNPVYQWPDNPVANYYYLYVINPAGTAVINEVLSDAGNCNGDTCSIDATTLREQYRLINGTYRAYVRTWTNSSTSGAWQGPYTFTMAAPVPALVTLDAVTNVNTLRPTFHWTLGAGADNATYFRVYVSSTTPASKPVDIWVTRTAACGSSSGTTCSYTPTVDLVDGRSYNLFMQSYGPGGFSVGGTYNNGFAGPQPFVSDAPAPTLPVVTVQNNQGRATISWNDDANATQFNVYVMNAAGVAQYNVWHPRASVCNAGACAVTPVINLPNGSYRAFVRAFGAGGYSVGGPYNNGFGGTLLNEPFVFNFAVPNIANLTGLSPSNGTTLDSGVVTFSWDTLPNTTLYYLWIGGASPAFTPVRFQRWYDAATTCTPHPGTCTVVYPVALPQGAHTWRVQAYGPGGLSALNNPGTVITVNATVPGQQTLNNPTGSITTNAPSFTWTDAPGVDWYNVYIYSATATIHNLWYRADPAAGICNGTTCTLNVANMALANGNYWWNVRANTPAGTGPFNPTGRAFTVAVPIPAIPTMVTPLANAVINTTNRPTFVWNTTPNAFYYNLEVKNGMGTVVFTQWLLASSANCTGGVTCTLQLPNVIAYGGYSWRVQAWSQGGFSGFSAPRTFFSLSTSTQPLVVESDGASIRRSGGWTTQNDERAAGASYLSSSGSAADTLTLYFSGTEVQVVYLAGPQFGSFVIEIDGVPVQAVNANATEASAGNLAAVSGLSASNHVLRIVPLGGAPVAIDALIVAGQVLSVDTSATPQPSPTMEIPTVVVTEEATVVPTEAPTEVPTEAPTAVPTEAPTVEPTAVPTEAPTAEVTAEAVTP